MDPAFQNANSNRTGFVVLGLELYPLTIGHVFLLCDLGVVFMVDEVEPKMEDILTFTLVASQRTADEARSVVFSRLSSIIARLWGRLCRRKSWSQELETLREYIASQCLTPKIAPAEGKKVFHLNGPEHWRLLAMLISEFNMSINEAMGCTLNFARALWAAEGERRGNHSLVYSPATSRAIDELRAKTVANTK